VADLYAHRAAAFGGQASALAGVYTTDCPLRAVDEAQVRALATAGERLRGFTPVVVGVSAFRATRGRVELRVTDRWAGYDVVSSAHPDGPALRSGAPRAEAEVRMVLVSTKEGWRIDQAQRVG
jgi:hypothetical protein